MCGEILVALVSEFRVVFIIDGVIKFEFSGVFFFFGLLNLGLDV